MIGAHIPLPLYYQLESISRLLSSDSRLYNTLYQYLHIARDVQQQEQQQTMISDAVKSLESFINPQAYENTYKNDATPTTGTNNTSKGSHHYVSQQTLEKLMNTPIHH